MKFTETKRTLSVLIFLLVYFGLILYFLPVQYAVNDDYAILTEIKNNVNTSFMSPILGYFLSFLYYLNACIPWYGLFLYFIHFVALYILITTVLKRNWNKMLSYGFLFIYLVFYLDFLQKVSYNNSSIMLGITVVVYFLFNIRNLSNARSFLVGLLFAISYLIRGEAIFFVLCFSAPAFYLEKKYYRKMFYLLFPAIMIISLHMMTDNFAFSEEQKNFNEFNKLRGAFHCYPVAMDNYNNQNILKANNWTKNDYWALDAWFFMDERKFNAETMENIFKYSIQGKSEFNTMLNEVTGNIKGYYIYYLFAAIFLLLFIPGSSYASCLIASGYFIYCFSGIVVLQLFFRFPSHIAAQVFMIMFLVMFFLACSFEIKLSYRRKSIVIILLVLYLLTLKIYDISKSISNTARMIEFFNRVYVVQLNQKYQDGIFILPIMPSFLPIEYSGPFMEAKLKINIIPYGWLTYSPSFYKSIKKHLKVDNAYELFPAIALRNDVYLMGTEHWMQFVQIYLNETFGNKYRLMRIAQLGGWTIGKDHLSIFVVKEGTNSGLSRNAAHQTVN